MSDEPEVHQERAERAAISAHRNRVSAVVATILGTYFVVYGALSIINAPHLAWIVMIVSGVLMGFSAISFYWVAHRWEEAESIHLKMYSLAIQRQIQREWSE